VKDDALAASTWLRLLKVHGLVLRRVRRRVPAGLTLPQLDVLAQLARREDGMTPGELTRELLVTAGNVTGIVDRLVTLGLVERRKVPEDRRAIRVRLTAAGRRLMQRALPRHRQDVAEVLGALPDRRLRELRELLGEACAALQRAEPA
jgi:DNA-binding MarR family transcriptional regulator